MLKSNHMVGFVLTTDARKARRFYEETLGFEFVSEDQFALVVRSDENQIRISPVKAFTPAQHTVLGWEVEGIEETARRLKARGVTFEHYPWMRDGDVWSAPGGAKVAWFKDPDGNVLSISEHPL